MRLPDQYKWLLNEPGPKMLVAALKYYGLKEYGGSADNPEIMQWAKDFGISWYTHDSTAWCSLFLGKVAKDTGKIAPPPDRLLAAISWADWGASTPIAMLGDVLVFNRPGGHHVGLYVGEDHTAYHVLGGNTSDQVGFARLAKDRINAIRRPAYTIMPANVRRIILSDDGALSQNEA